MQEGEPGAETDTPQETTGIQVTSGWEGCRIPGMLGTGKLLGTLLCPLPEGISAAFQDLPPWHKSPHNTGLLTVLAPPHPRPTQEKRTTLKGEKDHYCWGQGWLAG